MKIEDKTDGKLKEAIHLSRKLADKSLINCLRRLKNFENCARTVVYTDFAPFSFYFEHLREDNSRVLNGGVIFHGKHDGGGNGGAPTFSVSMTPQNGWSIHT